MHGRAFFRRQKIGAGDPRIRGFELRPQHGPRFRYQRGTLSEGTCGIKFGVRCPERVGDLFLAEMEGGGDDVAWRLVAQLHDVFAKIGLDRLDALASR